MPVHTFLALLPALFGFAAAAQADRPEVRSVVVHNELIIRIPVRPIPSPPAIEWVEVDGPRCIAAEAIRGATLSGRGHVDFLLHGRRRVRAELGEDCPALDFYNGFYLAPEDDRICARRDVIRSRIGGSCPIERFHRLVPRQRQVP